MSKSYYQIYLKHLSERPLLTKAITAGVLSSLNETLASIIAKDFQIYRFNTPKGPLSIKHVLSVKILLMGIYGCFINAPLSHYLYKILNIIYKPPLSRNKKIAQLLTSLSTVTPLLSTMFLCYLTIINNKFQFSTSLPVLVHQIKMLTGAIKSNMKKSLWPMIKSGLITSSVSITIAQNMIEPELWVVFFNVVYFVLGTVQNTRVKMKLKK